MWLPADPARLRSFAHQQGERTSSEAGQRRAEVLDRRRVRELRDPTRIEHVTLCPARPVLGDPGIDEPDRVRQATQVQIIGVHPARLDGDGHVPHGADGDPAITGAGKRKRHVHAVDPQRPRFRRNIDRPVARPSEQRNRVALGVREMEAVLGDLGIDVDPAVVIDLVAKPHRHHRLAIASTPAAQLQREPFGREDGEGRGGEYRTLLGLPRQLPVRLLATIIHGRVSASIVLVNANPGSSPPSIT
jgi:hypothetical protein